MRKKNHEANKKKVVVGMSGGVDSSLALLLLKEQGYEPIGVSLKLPVWRNRSNCLKENVCCTKEAFSIAKKICRQAGVKHYILDVSRDFQKVVIKYFLEEYANLRTPNPCIICNRGLKFRKLLEFADKHGVKYVATGHYARIAVNGRNEKWELQKAKDKLKDQTYSLSCLPQKWLPRIMLPLGEYLKSEVYAMAKDRGLGFFEKTKQSQDFCFVSGKSLHEFLKRNLRPRGGEIIDEQGAVLGKHKGLCFYTLGQRKGINVNGGPYYVIGTDAKKNRLIISKDSKAAWKRTATLSPCYLSVSKGSFKAKTRAQQETTRIFIKKGKTGKWRVDFGKNGKLLTPGQFCVVYNKGICLGGGRILL